MNTTSPALIAYLRVSTTEQGRSGLGIEGQRAAIQRHADFTGAVIVAEFVEVMSGGNDDRPQLAEAMRAARLHKATLIVSTLDRLSRDVAFIAGVMKAGVNFIAADMPTASTFELHIRAAISQEERAKISQRTRAALAAAKARGVKLGGDRGTVPPPAAAAASAAVRTAKAKAFALDVLPHVDSSLSLAANAARLDALGIPTARGSKWTATAVRRAIQAAAG